MTARSSSRYEIRLAKAAVKQLRGLDSADQKRVRKALTRQADVSGDSPGSRGGKLLKSIRGRHDRFFRLRVGELRIMFDIVEDERTLLIHAIVNRRDLERWLRGR